VQAVLIFSWEIQWGFPLNGTQQSLMAKISTHGVYYLLMVAFNNIGMVQYALTMATVYA